MVRPGRGVIKRLLSWQRSGGICAATPIGHFRGLRVFHPSALPRLGNLNIGEPAVQGDGYADWRDVSSIGL
jgi:hypothetical protein